MAFGKYKTPCKLCTSQRVCLWKLTECAPGDSPGVHDEALDGLQALRERFTVGFLIVLSWLGNSQPPEGTLKLCIVILPAVRPHLQRQPMLTPLQVRMTTITSFQRATYQGNS